MKHKIFDSRIFYIDSVLLFVRIAIAILMLVHGIPKLQHFTSGEQVVFMNFMGMGPEVSMALAIFAEVLCSILILIGLGTRVAVIPLIITMLVAVLVAHGEDPFSRKEMGLHYLLVYIMLLFTGSGRYSVDHLITGNNVRKHSL